MAKVSRIFSAYDYYLGAWLILMPWLLDFNRHFIPTVSTLIIGVGIITYSLFTNYEFGLIKLIPDSIHSIVDILSAVLLCAAPWLFGYSKIVFLPQVLTGIFCLVVAGFDTRQRHGKKFKLIKS
jgi:hypothetical protein